MASRDRADETETEESPQRRGGGGGAASGRGQQLHAGEGEDYYRMEEARRRLDLHHMVQ